MHYVVSALKKHLSQPLEQLCGGLVWAPPLGSELANTVAICK